MNQKRKSRLCHCVILICVIIMSFLYVIPSHYHKLNMVQNSEIIASELYETKKDKMQNILTEDESRKEFETSTFGKKETENSSAELNEETIKTELVNYPEPELDMTRKSMKMWMKPQECSDYVVRFSQPGSRNFCALSSYPGSGNTWFRYLLEATTGIFTGSIYQDSQLLMWGYLGENEDWTRGTTIVQKSHDYHYKTIESFNSTGIILIRNPYRAILSYHNFLFGSHKLYAPIVNYRRKDWPTFVHIQLRIWLELVIFWMKKGKNLLVIHYENLSKNPIKELRRAMKFLKVPVDENRFNCLKKSFGQRIKRQAEHFPKDLSIFSNVTRDKMDRAIRYVDYLLQKHGHEAVPSHLYEFYNGTSSNKISFVECEKEESIIECDNRIDNLNIEFSVQNERQKLVRNQTSDGINRTKDGFSKLLGNKVQSSAMKILSSFLVYVTKNPLDNILQQAAEIDQNSENTTLIDPMIGKIFA